MMRTVLGFVMATIFLGAGGAAAQSPTVGTAQSLSVGGDRTVPVGAAGGSPLLVIAEDIEGTAIRRNPPVIILDEPTGPPVTPGFGPDLGVLPQAPGIALLLPAIQAARE
ncbi:MAG: hypothetical protein RLO50_06940 [Azospirillaceae bacterium]